MYFFTMHRWRLWLILCQVDTWKLVSMTYPKIPASIWKADYIQRFSQARCDMDSDNGGWLVIQRRVEGGTVDFYRDWEWLWGWFWGPGGRVLVWTTEYTLSHQYSASMELRMDMEDESGNKITWTYQEFRVEGPENKYRLHIGGGEGTPGTTDLMSYNNNRYFSTEDRDNDSYSS